MASNFEFNLPDIGEGVTEGEIVQWLVNEGDTVTEDQAIVEIMTDKATVEIASPVAGTIAKKGCEEGDMLKVGSLLALINSEASAEPAAAKEKTIETPTPQDTASTETSNIINMPATTAVANEASYILASPATRKLARENGLALSQIPATGEHGRVLKDDVQNVVSGSVQIAAAPSQKEASPQASPAPAAVKKPLPSTNISGSMEEERIPVRGIRKIIAENMVNSIHTAAHFTHVDEFDATELVKAKDALKADAEVYGIKLTFLPFFVKALCRTLKEFPKLNASLDDAAQEIVLKKYYNIGIAVATKDDDLIVPVIHNADQKGLLQIASEIDELAERARHNKLGPEQLKGGTFTVTSMGKFGGLVATPIINHPQVGILGIQKIQDRVVARNGEMVIRKMANASISLDHRVVDGYLGAQFLVRMFEYLEQPSRMLL